MMALPRHVLVLIAAVAAFSGGPLIAPAFAQAPSTPTGEAQRKQAAGHFSRAVDLYKEQDFAGALSEFKQAYDVSPHFSVLYNIGQTERELHHHAEAKDALERYLADGGGQVPAARVREVKDEIARLVALTGELIVKANIDGAEVRVDDVHKGATPLAHPLRVNVGQRKVTLSRSGMVPVTKAIDVPANGQATVDFELVSPTIEVVAARPEGKAPSDAKPAGRSPAPWIATGVGGAATLTFALLTKVQESSLEDARNRPGVTRDELDSTKSKVKGFALATDILGGTTVVLLAYSLWHSLRAEPVAERAGTAGVRVVPVIGPGSVGAFATF
jgi:hypothetical protein